MKNATVAHIQSNEKQILDEWVTALQQGAAGLDGFTTEQELRHDCKTFLDEFNSVLSPGSFDANAASFEPLRKMMVDITKMRSSLGYTAKESGLFIFSLKSVLHNTLKKFYEEQPLVLLGEIRTLNDLIDELATITFDTFIQEREEIIKRQRQELLEASTPVIKLWDGILGVPIIGTIDSQRSQQIMQTLLNAIVDTGFEVAIIDISGVSTLDTLTAQHILKTSAAARLMGATCIISGISPAIAQTIVNLDIDLGNTKTKSNMAEAIRAALRLLNQKPLNEYHHGQDSDTQNGRSIVNNDTNRPVR
jgi:rsbT co-antagonist protein RsbR